MDDRLCESMRAPIELIVYTVGVYLSATCILHEMSQSIQDFCGKLVAAIVAAALAWAAYRLVDIMCEAIARYSHKSANKLDDLIIMLLRKTLRVVVVVVAVLLIGQNIMGINITTLLAGAGIFGLALAFAAQDTIANFFGSIMIVVDKPFFVGDRIKVGEFSGTVKSVGFRSTRLETPDGHVLT